MSASNIALLLCDLQNDFVHPNGAYGRAGQTAREIAALPARLAPLADLVRRKGGWIVEETKLEKHQGKDVLRTITESFTSTLFDGEKTTKTEKSIVTYELAGDELLQSALVALGAENRVSFIKNNVDHHTGATFGCHENYLMRREAQFTPPILGTLLTFLATRQIFTGAGRVGQSNPLAFDFEPPQPEGQVSFQLSQRADHIAGLERLEFRKPNERQIAQNDPAYFTYSLASLLD